MGATAVFYSIKTDESCWQMKFRELVEHLGDAQNLPDLQRGGRVGPQATPANCQWLSGGDDKCGQRP